MGEYTLGDLLNRIKSHALETTTLKEDDISIRCENDVSSTDAQLLSGSMLEIEIIEALSNIIAYYIADGNNPRFVLLVGIAENNKAERRKIIHGYEITMGIEKRSISAKIIERPLELMYSIGKRLERLKIKFPPEIEFREEYSPIRMLMPQNWPMRLLIPQKPKIESFVHGNCLYIDPKKKPTYQTEVINIYIPREYVNLSMHDIN